MTDKKQPTVPVNTDFTQALADKLGSDVADDVEALLQSSGSGARLGEYTAAGVLIKNSGLFEDPDDRSGSGDATDELSEGNGNSFGF